ncbi:hypothetical protein FSP39_008662 [Pinctada imbricata]|uniref:AMP-dependent synthetase/ligase domain-containing protein n=1 Tax=Pinctada imbricata TaxID=66713 RepID=A0AA88XZT4_PINIB|nr:hypothetical protein FSP39_008662 [Pinctada imbricata]
MLAEQTPDKAAVIFVGENDRVGVTFKEIVEGASLMARKMVKMGIKRKDVVAIHDDKSPAWLFYTFGAQMCGAWPLHFCFQQPDGSDAAEILKRGNCKVVITQPGDGDEYIHIMKSFMQFHKDGTVRSDVVSTLKEVLLFKKSGCFNQILTFEDIEPSAKTDLPLIEPENTAAIFCSSGSTGLPKLIPWSHNNLIATSITTNGTAEIRCGEAVFYDRTFGWFGGYPREIFIGVSRVTNSTSFKGKSSSEICDITVKIVNQERCDHVVLLSSIIEELMKGTFMMKHVKSIISSGGPVSSADAQLVGSFCDKFVNMYGSTECGVVSLNSVAHPKEMKNYDTGRPFPGAEVKIVDANGRLCEVGTLGEVYVRSRSSSTGHLHEEQDWHKANRVEGYWFRTGDSGYISEGGHLIVAGRISESIIIEGKLLSPSHFEDIFMRHPHVEEAAQIA